MSERLVPLQRHLDPVAAQVGALHRHLVDALPQSAVYVFDMDLRYLLAGGEAMRVAGLDPAAVLGRRLQDIVSDQTLTALEPVYRAALAGEYPELEHPGEDGVRWYRVRLRPVRDDDGRIVAGLAVTDDITEQRAAQNDLLASRARWQRLFDQAPIGMWLSEPGADGRLLQVNDAFCASVRRSRTDLLASTQQDLLGAAASSTGAVEVEMSIPGGGTRWFSVTRTLQRDEAGDRDVAYLVDITDGKQAERAAREGHAFQQAVLAASPHLVTVYDVQQQRSVWASGSLHRMLGHELGQVQDSQSREGLAGLFHPDDVGHLNDVLARAAASPDGTVVEGSNRVQDASGQWRHLARRTTPFRRDPDGRVVEVLSVAWDRTEELQAHEELEQTRAFQQAILDTSPDVVLLIDADGSSPTWSSRDTTALFGLSLTEIRALGERPLEQLVVPEDIAEFQAREVDAWLAPERLVVNARCRIPHRTGMRWLSWHMTPFTVDEDGAATALLAVVREVTDAVATERRLELAALHDPLTRLPNRRYVADRLDRALTPGSSAQPTAVLLLDLDGFKQVNDTHGHDAGDEVLVETARRLRSAVRPSDTVARLGGDEFLVLLHADTAAELVLQADEVAHRLQQLITRPIGLH